MSLDHPTIKDYQACFAQWRSFLAGLQDGSVPIEQFHPDPPSDVCQFYFLHLRCYMQFLYDGERGYVEWGQVEPALPTDNLKPVVHVAFAKDGFLVGYEGTIAASAPYIMKAALKHFGRKVIRKPLSHPLNLSHV